MLRICTAPFLSSSPLRWHIRKANCIRSSDNMANAEVLKKLADDVQKAVAAHSQSEDNADYDNALSAIQKLQLAVERPGDFAARVRFQGLQNAALVMLGEMGVLQTITANGGKETTSANLASQTGCDELLIVRLMRMLTAVGICEETGINTYRSNAMMDVLASDGQQAGMKYMTDLQFHIISKIRDFMLETQIHTGSAPSLTACQFAFGKSFWQILDESEEQRANFNEYMKAARRGGQVQLWHERYPPASKLSDETLKTGQDAVLMVDVGGGVGGQVGAFRKQYPNLPGRCVLQDLPDTISRNQSPPENVECIAYNFFEPQPIKGARLYLFRSVCHDWDDGKSRELLSNTVAAMDPGYSRLLIDEWVLPDSGVNLKAVNMDINMILMFNAIERTKSQWRNLLADVGLEIVEIYSTPGAAECVIETKCKSSQ